jgi:HEPN domain-containing protein
MCSRDLLAQELPLLYPSCFHSQQAAEKYLKAFLTWQQIEFPKTHNISDILNLVKKADTRLASDLQPVVSLTPFGVDVRYPGDIPGPSRHDAEEALTLAKSVRDAVLRVLPPEPDHRATP